ncbi:LysR family transcriptional regulator [Mycolicibacterium canariasense]|uniref:Probable hydrogen peroxide-inducible genes activator n=2 Tax=Mycolicibacterium canariasense TaxID=228230 RepID=A0A117I8W2_MYCCR|nr:LysR family transcriptional regulator [Mycolicibacterium canariasense]ORV19361.1 LysR family transcriptional regulator [Mycolicibacterium canariasense]GAS93840.1 LysR family transcriptional regulator [Mycolicibacterium canariasense]
MRMFIAVVEEGSVTAAARRLHISQPALSQAMVALERRLGLELLVRHRTGVALTDAGRTLLTESRAVLARHDQALAALTRHDSPGDVLRLGIPLELPPDLLPAALARLGAAHPETRVQARHATTAVQLDALRNGELDVGLVRERPTGPDLDATLAVEERLGVLLARTRAEALLTDRGVRLEALAGLDWVGFPRSGSPAWFDELTAILRSHGVSHGSEAPAGEPLIAEVKLASVTSGRAFALAPPHWSQPMPDDVSWYPLVGSPLVRRTWAVWAADSRRLDIAHFVDALQNEPAAEA